MIRTQRLDLPLLMPAEAAACYHCLERLEEEMEGLDGVSGFHADLGRGVAIVHFDPKTISLDDLEAHVRGHGERLSSTYAHHVLPVEGMDCTDCALTVEKGVGRLPGVTSVSVNFAGARLAVEYDADKIDLDRIARRVTELGYRVGTDQADQEEDERHGLRALVEDRHNLRTALGAILTLLGVGLQLSRLPASAASVAFAAAIVVAGWPIARKGIAALWTTHRLDINMLMTIAVIGAAVLGEWLEGATVVVLFSLGEALEGYTVGRARRSIRSLLRLAPAEATVRDGDGERTVPVASVVPGDIVVIRPGQRVPVDGIIVAGQSALDQAPVTGESVPVEVEPGATVFAGSVNGSGVLEVRATRPASDSTIARIIRMVETAQSEKAPTQRFVDRFAAYYTPAVVLIAAMIAVLPPLVAGGGWSEWVYRALVLLVIACPCALIISTPVSIVSALAAAARDGVLIKGGAHLEAAGTLRAVAFDKTGTLTVGEPSVTSVVELADVDRAEILRLAAAVERYSEHPLGRAVVRAAEAEGLTTSASRVVAPRAWPGRGIAAKVDGVSVVIGNPRLIGDEIASEDVTPQLTALEQAGQTPVLVAADGQLIGIIGLADQPRPGVYDDVQAVRRAGVAETVMLTGDRRAVAEAVASETGVDTVLPELLPEHKVRAVEKLLEEHGTVGMVGDGINDAPALARATVGIAMGAAGSDTALETADIALMGDDLSKVAHTIRLSRATRRIIMQNVVLALGIKLIFLGLAAVGIATLWEAVFADVGASLIVIANGMRLLRYRAADAPPGDEVAAT